MKVIVAIDQGTQSTRCIFYNEKMQVLVTSSKTHKQHYPQSGWCEHDPLEIIENVYGTMNDALEQMRSKWESFEIVSVGITNQRETIVAWDAATDKPLHNAIVWLDIRAEAEVAEFIEKYGSPTHFIEKTGLVINPYFSAFKLAWMSKNLPWFKEAVENETIRFGTMDSWIIYNLTGNYVTDITNASRTFLMDIDKCIWSTEMLRVFGLNSKVLPEILPNCAEFGLINNTHVSGFKGVRITASIGDQQSACVGHGLLDQGTAKLTLGTGGFILINTGKDKVKSFDGLLSTPCYKTGNDSDTIYALEGSIAIAGAGITWLQDMGIIKHPAEVSDLLKECKCSEGVVFVPAFSGLFAPRWRSDARGSILGMTQRTKRMHIVRAFCESIGFQLREIILSFIKDMNIEKVPYICVDGGVSKNSELLQVISDITNTPLESPEMVEATCAGAAMLAGLQAKVWGSLEEVRQLTTKQRKRWDPQMSDPQRNNAVNYWNLGVNRSLSWQLSM
eukprot:XP_001609066.1 glycerol kinase [Babesia bovis T2Bo]